MATGVAVAQMIASFTAVDDVFEYLTTVWLL